MSQRPELARLFLTLIVPLLFASAAHSASTCSNVILETEGAPLLRKYEQELKKALIPQLKNYGWKKDTGLISVQNLPNARNRIAPHYMIRLDLIPATPQSPKVVLRNNTIQTALKVDSYPLPNLKACKIVLQATSGEYLVAQKSPNDYLVNVDTVPTKIYIPRIEVDYVVPIQEANEPVLPARPPRATVASGTIDSVITHRAPLTRPEPATQMIPASFRDHLVK
jgi:hypothetical protein